MIIHIYIHKVFSNLTDERQKTCVLLLDEVYVKAMLLYHGGVVFGHAVNKPSLLADTVLSIMVVTLLGGPNFLCKMFPVRNLDAKFLFDQTNLILNAIKKSWWKCSCHNYWWEPSKSDFLKNVWYYCPLSYQRWYFSCLTLYIYLREFVTIGLPKKNARVGILY